MKSPPPVVKILSDCSVKPAFFSDEAKQPLYFSQWDLAMLSVQYIQKGLLFRKPSLMSEEENLHSFLQNLKKALSLTLVHFYPLAGRLVTRKKQNPHLYSVYADCTDSPGARFLHAAVDLTVEDVLSPKDVPIIVQSFFDHDRAINHDGHVRPLVTIQVTELIDGIFIGCSMNHALGDGTSYWHFFNTFSEIFRNMEQGISVDSVSRAPDFQRWFPTGYGPILSLPYTHHDEFTSRIESPILRERIFHFSIESLANLKSKANRESKPNLAGKISSLQALSALMWRCITRARQMPEERKTSCRLAFNARTRLQPPLSENYFGNCIQAVPGITTTGDLLRQSLGLTAGLLHETVAGQSDRVLRDWVDKWIEKPVVYQLSFFDPDSIMMGSSPRFDMYGNEFGLGKALAVRSGYAHKFDGKVTLYPGREGGGSMDLEVTLFPDFMGRLESDPEFINAMSTVVE